MRPSVVAAASVLAVAACAPYPARTPAEPSLNAGRSTRQCFHSGRVNGFREAGRDYVDLTVGANKVYRVQLMGSCPDIDWTTTIGVRERGGGSLICDGYDVELIVPSVGRDRTQVCLGRSVRLLTPAEVAAPPPR